MNKKYRILILSFTASRNDPRVYRQLLALRDIYDITVVGFGDLQMEGVQFFPMALRPSRNWFERAWRAGNLFLGNYELYLKGRYGLREPLPETMRFDAVIVNDLEPLPLGFALAKGTPVIFDAHEYYPGQIAGSLFWKVFFQRPAYNLCRDFIPRCAAMMTVSPGIATKYEQEFSVKPTLVYNAPLYHDLPVRPVVPDCIRMVHHGGALPGRKLEKMIEVFTLLDERFSLDLMLVPSNRRYLDRLKEQGKGIPRLRFINPAPMPKVVNRIAEYDIGLYLLECGSFNHAYAMPNKVFEFMQARLCAAVSPTPGMGPFVHENDLGIVSPDFSPRGMANALNALTADDILRYKQGAATAARIYTAEASMTTIRALVADVLQKTM